MMRSIAGLRSNDDLRASDFRKLARKLLRNPWNSNLDLTQIATILNIRTRGRTRRNNGQIQGLRTALRRSTDEFLDQAGLTSFSLNASHPLLWGHYAAGYTGICIVFRRNCSMQSGLCLCAKVSYVRDRPRLPLSLFYKLREAQRADKPIDKFIDQLFYLSFLHKSREWEHEQEARIFCPYRAFEKLHFHQNELMGIIIGPRSSQELENKIRQEVQNVPSISVQRASLSPNGFGIVVPPSFATPEAQVA